MRTKELTINNKKITATLFAGGPGFKIYGHPDFGFIVNIGRKYFPISENSPEDKIVANYVNLKYQNIKDQERIKNEFDALVIKLNTKNNPIKIEDELRDKYFNYLSKGPKGFPHLDIFDLKERDAIELKLIEVSPEHRGKGIGRKIMDDLIQWADANKKIIVLSPSEIKTNKLIKWYKEFDFLENKGRNKDFRFMNRMIRYPLGLTRSKWIDSSIKNNPTKDRPMKSSRELKTGIIIKSFERTFHNADYWRDTSNDRYIDNHEEAMALAKKGHEVIGVHSHLLISDSYGIYIPQKFCENFDLNTWGLSESDKDVDVCLAGPDEEWYWEAWNTILNNAKHIDADGCEWHLEQDGDLFTVHYSEYEGEEDEDVRSNPRPRKFKDIFVIVGHSSYGKEDIDQFDTLQEARKMLIEYRMAMPTFALKIVKRKEPLEVKSNPSDEIDEIAVREIYLTITNEGEFYSNYLLPLYRASEKFYKKGQYDSKKFVNALQKGINDFTLHGPLHFYYHRKFYSMIPKAEREEIAKMIERDFLNEIAIGNSYLP
jgi:ribosomal protein S18 acetylase RimI-like enzyme